MKPPVTIQRQKDGRHAVMDGDGNVMGMHNSVWSAARQVHEYGGGEPPEEEAEPVAEGGQPEGTDEGGDLHPPVPRPSIPRPPKTQKPKPDRPNIPRPK